MEKNREISEDINFFEFPFLKLCNDDKKTIVYANDDFFSLIGYTREEFKEEFNNEFVRVCDYTTNNLNIIKKQDEYLRNEYSIIKKDKSKLYILEKSKIVNIDGNEYLYTTIIELNDVRDINYEFLNNEKKLYAVLEDSDLFYWEYDINNNKIISSNLDKKIEDYNLIKEHPVFVIKKKIIKNDYIRDFLEMHKQLRAGAKKVQKTIAILSKGEYSLYLIKYNVYYDKIKKTSIAFGTAENADKFVELENRFSIIAENEGIKTWIYNIYNKTIDLQPLYHERKADKRIIEDVPFSTYNSIHPDDRKRYMALYDKVNNGDMVSSAKFRVFNTITENYDWYKVTYSTIFDKNHVPIKAFGTSVNINKEIDAEMKASSIENYHNILYNNCSAFFKLNLTKNLCEDNEVKSSILNELLSQNTVDGFFETIYSYLNQYGLLKYKSLFSRDKLINLYHNGQTSINEESLFIIDDQPIWMRTTTEIYTNSNTKDIEALIYMTDINDDKISRSISDKLIDVDYEFVTIINAKNEKAKIISCKTSNLYFIPKDNSIYSEENNDILKLILEPDQLALASKELNFKTVLKELEKSDIYERSYLVHYPNNKRYFKCWKFLYLDDSKTRVLFIRSDLTEMYSKEQKKSNQLKKALKAANIASVAKSDFLSRMSHDIRTPMNGIIGLINMAYEKEMPNDVREYLKRIEASSNYLLELLNDTLEMNKIETNKMTLNYEITDSREIIDTIMAVIKPSLDEKNISLNIDFTNVKFYPIKTDKVRIQQIFMNVFSNAVKFSNPNGVIDLSIKTIKEDDEYITDEFGICDHGIGMSNEFLKHVFDPFTQENNYINASSVGSGLGMAIVKRIIDSMGGIIKIYSEPNKGTNVFVQLQFEKGKIAPKEIAEETDYTLLEGKKILLVEDNKLNAEIAAHLLIKYGCIVDIADNGVQGLNIFSQSNLNEYACILMDIRMPIMDGLEATKKIRKMNRIDAKNIPIIALTANAFYEEIENMRQAGLNSYIAKPIQPKDFYKEIITYIKIHDEGRK